MLPTDEMNITPEPLTERQQKAMDAILDRHAALHLGSSEGFRAFCAEINFHRFPEVLEEYAKDTERWAGAE